MANGKHYIGSLININPTYITATPQYYYEHRKKSSRQKANEKNLSNNSHKNKLSTKARKSVNYALNWLYYSAKSKPIYSKKDRKTFYFKVAFITLTLPAYNGNICDEKLFQLCLNSWLTIMRKKFKLGNYLWKVEAQQNGQLHVHISCDQFIKYQDIRYHWNQILQKNNLLDEFFSKHGHYNPNSTDVHSTKKMYNAIAYISGYLKKDPNFATIYKGRIWGCSRGLSPKNKCKIEEYWSEADTNNNWMKDDTVENYELTIPNPIDGTVATIGHIWMLKKDDMKLKIGGKVKEAYLKHRKYIQSLTLKQPKEYYCIDLFGENSKVIYPPEEENKGDNYNSVPIISKVISQLEIF